MKTINETTKLIYELAKIFRHYMANRETSTTMTERDFTILEYLYDKEDSVDFSDICEHYKNISKSTISTTISSLFKQQNKEGKNLVDKRPDPENQRKMLIALTDAGKKEYEKTLVIHMTGYEKIRESFNASAEEETVLKKLLTNSINHFKDQRTP